MDLYKEVEDIRVFVACKIISEANNRAHWTVKSKRKNVLWMHVLAALNGKDFPLPCTVTFERKGPRTLDDDNLAYSFKGVRDMVSKLIIESHFKASTAIKRPTGYYDSDPRITWAYTQSKGTPGFYIDIAKRI